MLTASARKGSVEGVDGRRGQARPVSRAKPDRIDAVLIRHRSMTWQCRRCGRTVDLVLRDGDRCAACAMRTRAGRTLPDDNGARPTRRVDGWDVIRMRKLLLQPSSSSAGDAGAQDAIGEAIHEAGGDLGDAAS